MVDRLMRTVGAVLALWALAQGAPVGAAMDDPTRPPAGVLAPEPEAGEVTGPVLQFVLVPRRGKPVAVIGGQQVRLGERYGESRLVKLSEYEAVLDSPSGLERLRLTPDVEKTNIVAKNVTKTPARRRVQIEGKQ